MGQDKPTIEVYGCGNDAIASNDDDEIQGNPYQIRIIQDISQPSRKPAEQEHQ